MPAKKVYFTYMGMYFSTDSETFLRLLKFVETNDYVPHLDTWDVQELQCRPRSPWIHKVEPDRRRSQ